MSTETLPADHGTSVNRWRRQRMPSKAGRSGVRIGTVGHVLGDAGEAVRHPGAHATGIADMADACAVQFIVRSGALGPNRGSLSSGRSRRIRVTVTRRTWRRAKSTGPVRCALPASCVRLLHLKSQAHSLHCITIHSSSLLLLLLLFLLLAATAFRRLRSTPLKLPPFVALTSLRSASFSSRLY